MSKARNMDVFGSSFTKRNSVNEDLATKVNSSGLNSKGQNAVSYDAAFKSFFSRLDVLAGILSDIIPEFRNLTIAEIKGRLTEDALNKDHAVMLATDDDFGGSQIKYDILVSVRFEEYDYANDKGKHEETIALHFDLEMQRVYNMKYDMTNRSVYYSSRLLGRQSVKQSSYDKLQPIRTVWIFLNGIPDEFKNSIVHIQLEAYDRYRNLIERSKFPGLNLIGIDYIFLSEHYEFTDVFRNDPDIVKFLQSIFRSKKGEIYYNPYNVDVEDVKEEVLVMTDMEEKMQEQLTDWKERAREEGIEEGRAEGVEEGEATTIRKYITNCRAKKKSEQEIYDEIIDIFGIPDEKASELMQE